MQDTKPNLENQSFSKKSNKVSKELFPEKVVTIRLTGPGLVIGLVFILLTGIGIGSLVVKRAGAAPEIPSNIRMNAEANSPLSLSTAFANAAQIVESSVVHITTVDLDGERDIAFSQSSGSGFVIDSSGYILTNYHVVKDANKIKTRFTDGATLTANLVGFDEETDLAVLKVSSSKALKASQIGDSERITVGDWVLAIGSPFGLEQTVTAGIISAKERITDQNRNFQQFLQTDAAINPGNSGGPLVNLAGEVIGINSQIATRRGNFEGVGFAVPASIFMDVYSQLITQGRVSRGYLGVYPSKVTPQFAQIYSLKEPLGALIHDITEVDGPAAKAGLKSGDVIVEFNGHNVKDDRDLVRYIVSTRVNTPTKLKYLRNGLLQSATVTLIERQTRPTTNPLKPIQEGKPKLSKLDKDVIQRIGIALSSIAEIRAQQPNKNIEGVVVRSVVIGNVAHDAGLEDGDIIKEVNKQAILKEEDFLQAINKLKSGDSLVLFIERNRRQTASHRYISLTIP
ncbi:MAG: trypsin-like peptidase domain-containing protein [Acidobacteria bacterium]|nr:trypsin-like peptidase domain-containing protein [Acidobacteriota bacterium]